MAVKIQEQVRKPSDLEYVTNKYPFEYLESMNAVLCQGMTRCNRLVEVVHSSPSSLQKVLMGQIVMTGDVESVGNAMFEGRLPALWAGKSYPSMKAIGRYIEDLVKRMDTLTSWLENGPPERFWISGFYFTQDFLTGVAQNFARKYKIPSTMSHLTLSAWSRAGTTAQSRKMEHTSTTCSWREHGVAMRRKFSRN